MLDVTVLHTELTTDPDAIGYAAPLADGNHTAVAVLLNTVRAGAQAVWRRSVPAADILASVVWADVSGWTAVKVSWLNALLAPGTVDATQARIRDMFVGIFGAGSASLTNVQAIAKVTPTRAEELFGLGTVVTESDVGLAMEVAP